MVNGRSCLCVMFISIPCVVFNAMTAQCQSSLLVDGSSNSYHSHAHAFINLPAYSDPLTLRETTFQMFNKSFSSYIVHAFPRDELRPITCDGVDSIIGSSLTLIDSLDTLFVLGLHEEFKMRVLDVIENVKSFDKDETVNLFEVNIRIVGGLLAAHCIIDAHTNAASIYQQRKNYLRETDNQGHRKKGDALTTADGYTNEQMNETDSSSFVSYRDGEEEDPGRWRPNGYKNELLDLAEDLATRLLPAFDTPTGIPYGSINLRHGVAHNESVITSTAAGGTLLLEWGALSRLTKKDVFEKVALRSMRAIWSRRSRLDLVGAHINILDGTWTQRDAGVGSGIDSFYEYIIKSHFLFGNAEYLYTFWKAYIAVEKNLRKADWYVETNMDSSYIVWPIFQSLAAFWPGLQTLIGDTKKAMRTIRNYMQVWRKYGSVPEGFNIQLVNVQPFQESYPLRPELAESLYYLYKATHDKELVQYARDILIGILTKTQTSCGFAAIRDVSLSSSTGIDNVHFADFYKNMRFQASISGVENKIPRVEDFEVGINNGMESFFLSETLKYLYLIFDEAVDAMSELSLKNSCSKSKGNNCRSKSPVATRNALYEYVFTTEGHLLPIYEGIASLDNIEDSDVELTTFLTLSEYKLKKDRNNKDKTIHQINRFSDMMPREEHSPQRLFFSNDERLSDFVIEDDKVDEKCDDLDDENYEDDAEFYEEFDVDEFDDDDDEEKNYGSNIFASQIVIENDGFEKSISNTVKSARDTWAENETGIPRSRSSEIKSLHNFVHILGSCPLVSNVWPRLGYSIIGEVDSVMSSSDLNDGEQKPSTKDNKEAMITTHTKQSRILPDEIITLLINQILDSMNPVGKRHERISISSANLDKAKSDIISRIRQRLEEKVESSMAESSIVLDISFLQEVVADLPLNMLPSYIQSIETNPMTSAKLGCDVGERDAQDLCWCGHHIDNKNNGNNVLPFFQFECTLPTDANSV